jgi:hypothetical protein
MHAREQILMHRLFLDIQTAAATRGYYLNTYFDAVDHDGFDVIFDDQDYIKKIQVKSVQQKGATGAWEIHKRMLRPSFQWLDMLGFESSPEGEGSEGGVVLIEFSDDSGEIRANYYYTDVFVLLLFYCDVIKRKKKNSQKAIEDIYKPWRRGIGSERVRVPKAAFLKAKDASSLLSLMGLHSSSQYAWKHHAMQLVCNLVGDRSLKFADGMDANKLQNLLLEEIEELCGDASVVAGDMGMSARPSQGPASSRARRSE